MFYIVFINELIKNSFSFLAAEDPFLEAVILGVNPSAIQFKLSPTYIVYLAVRFRLSHAYHPEMSPADRAHNLMNLVNKVGNNVQRAIQVCGIKVLP